MTHSPSPKRAYDSSRRKEQARQTRLRIAEAARTLFIAHGYAGATIGAIAAESGVAKETVYAVFRNKRRILDFLLDVSVGGDDLPVRLIDRPGPQAMLADRDPRLQVRALAMGIAEVMSRAAPIFEVTRIAAKTEPEIARRIRQLYRERLGNMVTFVRQIAANGPLHEEMDEDAAAELVWGISSPELFQLFTEYRGWSREQFGEWLAGMLERLLLP